MYDGEHTFGITIWFIMVLLMVIFVLFYFISNYNMAFGRRRLVRRIISKTSVEVTAVFDIKGVVGDRILFNGIEEAFVSAVGQYDKEVGIND